METQPNDSPNESQPLRQPAAERPRRSVLRWLLPLAIVLILAAAGYAYWSYRSTHPTTDDAQIEGHVHPVSARVAGRVIAVNVDDNQQVEAGAVLVRIDPTDYEVAVKRARANLLAARAALAVNRTGVPIVSTTTSSQLSVAEAAVTEDVAALAAAREQVSAARARLKLAQAHLQETQANSSRASRDLERMKKLIAKQEISAQRYDAAVAAAAALGAAVEAARAAVASARREVAVAGKHVEEKRARVSSSEAEVVATKTGPHRVAASKARVQAAQAAVLQAEAALKQTELSLSYTTVRAPVSGVVAQKSVESGMVIQPGQPLLAVVPLDDIWVVAKFKETKLRNMRVGQRAEIRVDAYGGKTYEGVIESISPGTAAVFSLLPPENATGNYVKVVQRVPVKIRFKQGQDPNHLLRPGMSVVPIVSTE